MATLESASHTRESQEDGGKHMKSFPLSLFLVSFSHALHLPVAVNLVSGVSQLHSLRNKGSVRRDAEPLFSDFWLLFTVGKPCGIFSLH